MSTNQRNQIEQSYVEGYLVMVADIDRQRKKLNEKELQFIASVRTRLNRRRMLSPKQAIWLQDIWRQKAQKQTQAGDKNAKPITRTKTH